MIHGNFKLNILKKDAFVILLFLLVSCSNQETKSNHRIFSSITSTNIDCSAQLKVIVKGPPPNFVDQDPLKQLKRWEQTSNVTQWKKPESDIKLEYVLIDPTKLNISTIELPASLKAALYDESGMVRWYKHPENTSTLVPFKDNQTSGSILSQYSASRSLFTTLKGDDYSFKLPTNKPHPNDDLQPSKADLVNDSIVSIRRSKHIRDIDSKRKKPTSLIILTELITISDKVTGNGFSVRDLRALQDGHYYLPGFSIPYAGKDIANHLGEDFIDLWGEFYSGLLGRAKAQLLIHYGLQMKTPNAQNWLVQLDHQLRPTGKIVMRDIADSSHVDFISLHNGSKKALQLDQNTGIDDSMDLDPFFKNSVWKMSDAGLSENTLNFWQSIHNKAYIDTVRKLLNIDHPIKTITELEEYLLSKAGVEKLKSYAKLAQVY